MYLSAAKLRLACRNRGLKLKDLLHRAGVSKTAYYSLLRKDSILPRSIHAIASALSQKPSSFLEEESDGVKKLRRLRRSLESVMRISPGLDRETVWHTLLLLEEKPIERLERGLLRAQKFNFCR